MSKRPCYSEPSACRLHRLQDGCVCLPMPGDPCRQETGRRQACLKGIEAPHGAASLALAHQHQVVFPHL